MQAKTSALYEFVTETTWADLPQDVCYMAKRCLMDLVGVAAAGTLTPLSQIVRDHAVGQFGGNGARLMFDGRSVSEAGAALAGAFTIDSIDAHDGHPEVKGHAGCGLLPALLALYEAESRSVTGQEFLTTLILAYELAIRAGFNLHASVPDYHTSGAWVAVGIAAVAPRLTGMDQTTWREAMGIAEYHGPRSQMMRAIDHPTMVKDGSGWGAMAGVSAVRLAQAGFTGAPAITIESSEHQPLMDSLGSRWMCLEQYFKPYPVCRWAQPAMAAWDSLDESSRPSPQDIETLFVHSFAEACALWTRRPKDTEQAQYSLPFALSCIVLRGRLGAEEVGQKGLEDQEIAAMTERCVPIVDKSYCDKFPRERWAHLEILCKDGRRLKSGPCQAHGGAENPISPVDLEAKFYALAEPLLGREASQEIHDLVWKLDEEGDLEYFFNLLRSARETNL